MVIGFGSLVHHFSTRFAAYCIFHLIAWNGWFFIAQAKYELTRSHLFLPSDQYNRIYSPTTFGKKYDPNGNYIRHFVPILKGTLPFVFFILWWSLDIFEWVFYKLWSLRLIRNDRYAEGVYIWTMDCTVKGSNQSKLYNWERLSETRSVILH